MDSGFLLCWRYLLPIFNGANRTNYSKEALLLICQNDFLLPERQTMQLLYSHFINTQGAAGKNIPCDLHMEHLNHLCKEGIRDLGANKTPNAIQRISKCLETVDPIVQQFNLISKQLQKSGQHDKASYLEDIKKIV